ncbi:MAG: DUF502 domain-containing protein [Pseudorhodobacter sp.]|nr:DUF502 domain-containing protein [Pseudorhodobacter sp.]
MSDPILPKRRSMTSGLRSSFLTGLVVVLPIGLTIYLIWAVIGWLDGWILPLLPAAYRPEELMRYLFGPNHGFPIRGVGVVVFLVFTTFMGWIAKGLIGRTILAQLDRLIERMPVVRSLYGALKQVADTVFNKTESSFEKTCLVEFPRPGVWVLGLISARPKGEIADKLGPDKIAVFIGLTPFTSGFVAFVSRQDVIELDLTVEEAAKLVASGGLVYPVPREVEPL